MAEVPLTRGKVAQVDDEDYQRVSQIKWHAHTARDGEFYAAADVGGQIIYLHRFVMDAPPNIQVDHKDHDKLNCHKHNLRMATHGQNMQNRNVRKDNKTRLKGVTWDWWRWKYRARITANKVVYRLGRFDTAEEAARARDAKECELFGEFANLNFPDEWLWNAEESKWHRIDEEATR